MGRRGERGGRVGSVSEEEQLRRLFLEVEGGGERKGVEHHLLLPISTPPSYSSTHPSPTKYTHPSPIVRS